jgi:dihydroflavonol-4-reductase
VVFLSSAALLSIEMNIAITGANGHVGASLIRQLVEEGHQVKALQHKHHYALNGLALEVVHGDLEDAESLGRLCKGADVVYHLAAKISIGYDSYDSLYKTNVEGTKRILHAAKDAGVKRFIHFSSIHAYNHKPLDQPLDETRPHVNHSSIPYESTKSIAEEWVLNQQHNGMDIIVLNPTAIIGPYDYKPSLLGTFLINLYRNSLPGLVPGGYNFVDVRDVCEAAVKAMHQGKGGEKYILSGQHKTVAEMAILVQEVTGRKVSSRMLPLWLAYVGVPFIRIWSKLSGQDPIYTRQSLDIIQDGNQHIMSDKARQELGYNPRPLSVTLKDTLEWFKKNNYLS